MNSTQRLASSLVFATATAFSVTAYAQTGTSTLERALSLLQADEHHDRDRDSHHRKSPFVGMWIITLYDGPYGAPNTKKVDVGIQQVSSDGNEFVNSSGFSPASGNSCYGIWKDLGHNTFKIRHTSWFFNATTGALEGVSPLSVLLTVSEDGHTYSGTYTSKAYDLKGVEVTEFALEGDVKATRFEMEGPDASVEALIGPMTSVKSLSSESPQRRRRC